MRLNVLKGIFAALTFLVISYSAIYLLVPSPSPQFEETTSASFIQDGDTFQTSAGDWIRLADVDCPDRDEYGYQEATQVLSRLLSGKRVYLDIDDINRFDYGGTGSRLVCVVYTDYNSTHYINVNYWLLVTQVADVYDFDDNEFSPYRWTLFVPKHQGADSTKLLGYSLGIGIIVTAIIYRGAKKVWTSINDFVREHG